MNQPNPIQMQKFLAGVDYPCDKKRLVEHAKSKGAGEPVLRRLQRIPDRTYDGPTAVSRAYAEQS